MIKNCDSFEDPIASCDFSLGMQEEDEHQHHISLNFFLMFLVVAIRIYIGLFLKC